MREVDGAEIERRKRNRFVLSLPIRYQPFGSGAGEPCGVGRLLDISSRGLAFSGDAELAPGRRVQAWIAWPVKLGDSCPLQLYVAGTVVRSERGVLAMLLQEYEFRTGGQRVGTTGKDYGGTRESRPSETELVRGMPVLSHHRASSGANAHATR